MSVQFSTWKDRGDNVGIECLVCHRTHWSENDPATNPITQQPCENCKLIKEEKVLAKENEKHRQKHIAKEGEETPEEDCDHQPSQP